MAASTLSNENVRGLVIDGPYAGRVMVVSPSEQEVALSPEEQVAWSELMATSRRVEERAARIRSKAATLLDELRALNAEHPLAP